MVNHTPVTHVIFDLDGTLLDSESIVTKALRIVVQKYNKQNEFSLEIETKTLGYPLKERTTQIWKDLDIFIDTDQFMAEIITECISHVKENSIHLMPGAERVTKHLHRHNIPLAIATGNMKKTFSPTVPLFGDFFVEGNYFHHVLLGPEDPEVQRPKPFPDIYQIAAKRFNPPPADFKHVLAFEDSLIGADAVLAAGMQCVLIPDSRLNVEDYRNRVTIFKSLDQFEPKLFNLPEF